ncbi:hypothetical protein C357_20857 [Citreicella sp. 357]|nr:hypothetical protein C357_20857 [Citreicella sp. 357]
MAISGGSAQALTTINSAVSAASSTSTINTNGIATNIDFTWSAAPTSAYVTFEVDATSYLYMDEYSGMSASPEYSAFMLYRGATNLTQDYTLCAHSTVLADIRGRCNLVTNYGASGAITNYDLTSTTTAFAVLNPGVEYLVGVVEGGTPADGLLSFQISEGAYVPAAAAVPLPAGGMLLLGALGGIAALRRRRKAA